MSSSSRLIRSRDFQGEKAWQAIDIANMNGTTIRLHWTNEPYIWHTNDGQEVFAVLSGVVNMHYKLFDEEKIARLESGDIFFADTGCEHVAKPDGEARILVIEKEGSI